MKIMSINITALSTSAGILATTDAHLIFLQEVAATKATVKKYAKYLRQWGWKLHASPVAQGVKGSGVGVMAREPITIIEWKAKSAAYKALHSIGRCAIYGTEVEGEICWYAVLYGATGGDATIEAAQKNDVAMTCLIDELSAVWGDPMCIVGDINADLESIPTAWDLILNEGWKDLGEHAQIWGGEKCQPTCQAPNSGTPTRRDYIITNPVMFQKVRKFEVKYSDKYSVHQPIEAEIEVGNMGVQKRMLRRPASAYQMLQDAVDEEHERSGKKEQEESSEEKQEQKEARIAEKAAHLKRLKEEYEAKIEGVAYMLSIKS